MPSPTLIAAGVNIGLSFAGGLGRSRSRRKKKRREAAERRRQALEAGQRLEIRLASMRRGRNRLQGARRAAVGASGQTRSGSAAEVLADRAREDDMVIELAELEGRHQINAILRGAAVLDREAGDINPIFEAITSAAGAASPFADDIADAFRPQTTGTAQTVLSGGQIPGSGSFRIPGLTGP